MVVRPESNLGCIHGNCVKHGSVTMIYYVAPNREPYSQSSILTHFNSFFPLWPIFSTFIILYWIFGPPKYVYVYIHYKTFILFLSSLNKRKMNKKYLSNRFNWNITFIYLSNSFCKYLICLQLISDICLINLFKA